MLAETPAERGRRLVDGHDDGHDDLDDADDDDDHDDDHDGSARRVDRITRPRRSKVSSVCGRSGTPPAVRNAAAGPSTRWCQLQRGEGVIPVNAGNDTAPGYVNRVSRSGLSG